MCLPDWYLLDYDNLQQNQIQGTVELYVMLDNSGLLCDAFNTTEQGEMDYTHIYIMAKGRFGRWLLEREKSYKIYQIFAAFALVFPDT